MASSQLYRVSHGALRLLEEQLLFADFRPLKTSAGHYPGIICKEKELYEDSHFIRHSTLMGLVYWIAVALFVGLAVYFFAVRQGCIKLPLPSAISASSPNRRRSSSCTGCRENRSPSGLRSATASQKGGRDTQPVRHCRRHVEIVPLRWGPPETRCPVSVSLFNFGPMVSIAKGHSPFPQRRPPKMPKVCEGDGASRLPRNASVNCLTTPCPLVQGSLRRVLRVALS